MASRPSGKRSKAGGKSAGKSRKTSKRRKTPAAVDRRRNLGRTKVTSTPVDSQAPPFGEMTREELIEYIQNQEGAGVRVAFRGKEVSRRIARLVQPRVISEIKNLGVGSPEERSSNLLIEGENLQAMVTLYRQRGQVDLILTDPPYNTGGDFRYNDKWDEDPNDPHLGELVSAEDGARHTKWMKFMWPRLAVMRDMLKPSGVLAICIDYRELFRLGQMLDELFGESNRLAIINWQKMAGAKNHDTGVATATEHVLVYARDLEVSTTGLVERSAATAGSYRNPDEDERGAWAPSDSTLMGGPTHPGQVYAIQNPFTGRLHYPQVGRCWRHERSKMKEAVEEWGVKYVEISLNDGKEPALVIDGVKNPEKATPQSEPAIRRARKIALKRREAGNWPRMFWRADTQRRPGAGELRAKTYEAEVRGGVVPTTFWVADDYRLLSLEAASWPNSESGTTDMALKELNAVVGRGHQFETVKPLKLMSKIISLWCPDDGLVLDPFAGSGTTGHAVVALNAETGSDRRFILIEQGRPERGDPYARALTADRLKRVVTGQWKTGKRTPAGGGFTFWSLRSRVDAKAVLSMKRDEMVDLVLASYFDSTDRKRLGLVTVADEGYRYLVAKNQDEEGFFLIWDGSKEPPIFDDVAYDAVVQEAQEAGLKAVYHVYARFNVHQSADVRFYQIPDRILMDFGLNVPSDAFNDQ